MPFADVLSFLGGEECLPSFIRGSRESFLSGNPGAETPELCLLGRCFPPPPFFAVPCSFNVCYSSVHRAGVVNERSNFTPEDRRGVRDNRPGAKYNLGRCGGRRGWAPRPFLPTFVYTTRMLLGREQIVLSWSIHPPGCSVPRFGPLAAGRAVFLHQRFRYTEDGFPLCHVTL